MNLKDTKILTTLYREKRRLIRKRLSQFRAVQPSDYFYELIYCLLTPQSSAEKAINVVEIFRKKNLKNKQLNPEKYLLSKGNYIRFHRKKATYIKKVKKQFPLILKQLKSKKSGSKLRLWLVQNVKGLGLKEASHFLRNIGYKNLAILDRHILKNLYNLGVIPYLPNNLTTESYLKIEKKFKKFSVKIGIPLDELDLLLWSLETGKILK